MKHYFKPSPQAITSITVVVYIIIAIVVTLSEVFLITDHFSTYLIFRLICIACAVAAFFVLRKNYVSIWGFVLIFFSFVIFNCAGYYFRPFYHPSFIYSLYTLAFFFFIPKRAYLLLSSLFTLIFIFITIFFKDSLPYSSGEMNLADLISVPLIGFITSYMVYYFYTLQRVRTHSAEIRFATLGRISARAIHDIKGSLSFPFLMHTEMKDAIVAKDFQQIEKIALSIENSFDSLKNYLIQLNEVVSLNNQTPTKFKVSNCVKEAVSILNKRLNFVEMDIEGDMNLTGSESLFTSVVLNLITNSLDEFELLTLQKNKISLRINKKSILYCDHIDLSEDQIKRLFNAESSVKPFGTGLGLYFIREALQSFNAELKIEAKGTRVNFRILF